MNDSKTDAPTMDEIVAAIRSLRIGAGSEHFRYGRELMREDAAQAVERLFAERGVEWTAR